jgi:hypothetical protein
VHHDRGKLGVVKARAAHALVTQIEAAGSDQVQGAARIGAQPDDVAGIRRNLRLQQEDVKQERNRLSEGIRR